MREEACEGYIWEGYQGSEWGMAGTPAAPQPDPVIQGLVGAL